MTRASLLFNLIMHTPGDIKLQNKLSNWSGYLAVLCLIVSGLALLGWQLDFDILKRPVPYLVAINPTTALLFVFCSLSFLLFNATRRTQKKIIAANILAGLVLLIACAKIYMLISGANFQIDGLLFAKKIKADIIGNTHNQMARNAAVCFLLIVLSMLVLNSKFAKRVLIAHLLALVTALIALLSILGYLYHVDEFYKIFNSFPIAFYAAVCFFSMSVALLFTRPDEGIMQEFTSSYTGGIVSRVFIPVGIIVPALLGLARLRVQWAGNISTESGVAFLILSIIVLFLGVTGYYTLLLNRRDFLKHQTESILKETEQSEKKYKLLFEKNPMPMWMIPKDSNSIVVVNESAILQYGYTRQEFLQLSLKDIFVAGHANLVLEETNDPLKENDHRKLWQHRKKDGTIIQVEVVTEDIVYAGHPVRLMLAIDVTEKVNATQLLKRSLKDLRGLAAHLENIREEERISIAREIHDELGQQLTSIKMDISWITKKIPAQDGDVKNKIGGITKLLDDAVKTIRRIATELRPSILDNLGLVAAIEWQSQEFETRSGIHTEFESPVAEISVPKNIATSLFRIYQESLTNVARHAEASKISSTLQLNGNQLILKITDNGKGFEVDKIANKKTLGLLGMKERTMMMGGKYEIISEPGNGTTILVTVPVE